MLSKVFLKSSFYHYEENRCGRFRHALKFSHLKLIKKLAS